MTAPSQTKVPVYSRFETELAVSPDDIDLNRHVHNSRYFDYVLAARYDQMSRCYKMSMEEFLEAGLSWVSRVAHLEFKRPLGLGYIILVRTWIGEIFKDGVKVHFEIVNKATGKLCCSGWFDYTLISLKTGRAEAIPAWIIEKYSI